MIHPVVLERPVAERQYRSISPGNRSSESRHEKGVNILPKTSPWHSIKASVHHNNTNCNTGNNIEAENRREGTGGGSEKLP